MKIPTQRYLCSIFFILLQLFFLQYSIFAIQISGVVVDTKGQPIDEAVVRFQETRISTFTDQKGQLL